MFILPSLLIGCSPPNITNPSGECAAETDGSRHCYHAPSATDTYVLVQKPHCSERFDASFPFLSVLQLLRLSRFESSLRDTKR